MFLSDASQTKKQTLVVKAVRRVFRPLVKLMLANDLGYVFASDLLKHLFVDVAQADFKIDGKRQTDARISLLTGVHRKDVKRLRNEDQDLAEVIPENVSLGSQLIALWNADENYLDAESLPKPLPRFVSDDASASFEGLVKRVSKDIHARAILDEWLRLGVARIDDQQRVCLTSDAFIPEEGLDEKIFYLSNNLHDHAEAAVSNVLGARPPYLERCVHYDGLPAAAVAEIGAFAEKQGMRALREVNRLAKKHADEVSGNADANQRMTFGVYYFYGAADVAEKREGG